MRTNVIKKSLSTEKVVITFLQILGFAVLTALCAHAKFYLPWTPVPITLQSLAVVLSGAMLGSKKGVCSQMGLIILGTLGFSVFTQPGSGIGILLGPTGGYILGFVLCAFVTGLIFEQRPPKAFLEKWFTLFIASLFIFLPGVLWLKVYTQQSLVTALQLGFLPFLVGDILKTIAAASFLQGLEKIRSSRVK